ncbi:catechol 2,3-dioxygenase [Deinococcus metalli]|uniref:Catechol 2,3-dioxygenase n=1 Tax=Deinococcus metalli TaxID=1141878 RepID=A0A7W8NQD0_9DEIO|nr:VOC family protein [Deinococcus metalli]MBB5378919.1 catechol 2,3-dioxygenase [Deinococcus metalli]GHF62751.1 glyoxalase [Deinococcus metalli]
MTTIPELHPDTTPGPVALTVHDLEGMTAFYRRVLGLNELVHEDGAAVLGTPEGTPLLALLGRPDAPVPAANATGLYHLAVVLPTRPDLARWFTHAFPLGIRLGQSDHYTHEAFYLHDPEGNGIEVYHDWPQEQWPFDRDTRRMTEGAARREDIRIRELLNTQDTDQVWTGAPDGTRMGHVHLKMADAGATHDFMARGLGLNITAQSPDMVFAAAGDYHHHVGNNAWRSRGGPTPQPGSRGLHHWTLQVPDAADLDRVTERLRAAGHDVTPLGRGVQARDPSGNRVVVVPGAAQVPDVLAALHA